MSGSRPRPGGTRTDLAHLRGVWRSHGYGTLLELSAAGYRLHEETRVSCLPVYAGTLDELARWFKDLRRSPGGQAFSARRATGVTRVRYRRLQALPERCAAGDPQAAVDPEHVFEVFWHTFAERYALFDVRGVDWHALHARFRPEVTPQTPPRRLYELLVEMLRPLRDGHVALHAPFGHFDAGGPSRLHRRIGRELGLPAEAPQVASQVAAAREQARAIVRDRYLHGRLHRSAHGRLEWGHLDQTTGYLAIRAMAGQSGHADQPREDQQAAAAAMTRVMEDLGHLPSIVVDVRDNGGGYDGVALRIAGHFMDRRRLAFTKAPSQGDGFGGRQAICVEPRGRDRYHGRIFLLTSALTVSAAEIFVLALLRQPRVTRIGEPTCGVLSDVMERHLPNGWRLHLSNELYEAADGELYEDRGVPVHEAIPFAHSADLEAGRDPMLEHVLAHPAPIRA